MDSLLDDLAGEGKLDSRGQFTLDATKIRERYASFQSDMDQFYLARLLQGLVDLGPKRVSVTVTRQELVLRAEGVADSLALQPVSTLLSGTTAFSQGLLTSLVTDCREVVVASGGDRLTLLPDGVIHLNPDSGGSERVEVALNFSRPKGLLGTLLGRAKENAAIHSFVTNSFASCAIPIVLDGRRLNGTPIPARPLSPYLLIECQFVDHSLELSQSVWGDARTTRPSCFYYSADGRYRCQLVRDKIGKISPAPYHSTLFLRLNRRERYCDVEQPSPCSMILALRREMEPHSSLYMVDKGMLMEAVDIEMGCPGLVAVVPAYKLAKDASGLRVVQDERFQELLGELKARAALAFADFESLLHLEKTASDYLLISEEFSKAQLAYGR